jgi:integration host factor subunit beta
MTKAELVDTVAARLQLTKRQTDAIVTLFFQCITEALQAGDKVELRGFGSFRLRSRPARAGRNPKTGAVVQVPAKQAPFFTAGKALRALVDPPPASRPSGPHPRSAQRPRG